LGRDIAATKILGEKRADVGKDFTVFKNIHTDIP
jgi:hypothetical protein